MLRESAVAWAPVALVGLAALSALAGCHRESDAGAPGDPNVPGSVAECAVPPCAGDAAPLPPAADVAGLTEDWKRATGAEADDDDLRRLAQREGAGGLEAKLGARDAATRHAAISALAFVPEEERFDPLPYLAKLAASETGGDADDVARALGSLEALSARPRRAVDREDGDALARGCALLAALASSKDAARAGAARRSLGMLADYGCRPDAG